MCYWYDYSRKPPQIKQPPKAAFLIGVFIVVKACRLGLRTVYRHCWEQKGWLEFIHGFSFLCCCDFSCFPYLRATWVLSTGGCCSWLWPCQNPPRLSSSDWRASFVLQDTGLKGDLWNPVCFNKFSMSVDKWSSCAGCYSFYFIWNIS